MKDHQCLVHAANESLRQHLRENFPVTVGHAPEQIIHRPLVVEFLRWVVGCSVPDPRPNPSRTNLPLTFAM